MNKQYHFISGLPHSGSTLLCNILAQNPQLHTGPTSGILDVMFGVRNQWDKLPEFRNATQDTSDAKLRVLRGILDAYYADVDRPVIFDKKQGWLAYFEMLEALLPSTVKVLVPVRDLREVFAETEMLWRITSTHSQVYQEAKNYFQMQTVEGRCQMWARPDQLIGLTYNRIKDALHRGWQEQMHFVTYENLTHRPGKTLRQIYKFLDLPQYKHNFNRVEPVTGKSLSQVEPQIPQWPGVLGDVAKQFANSNLW